MEGGHGGGGEAEEHSDGVKAFVRDPEIAGAIGEKAVRAAEVGVEAVAARGIDAGGGRDGGADWEGAVDAREFGNGVVDAVDEPDVLCGVDGDRAGIVDAAGGEVADGDGGVPRRSR